MRHFFRIVALVVCSLLLFPAVSRAELDEDGTILLTNAWNVHLLPAYGQITGNRVLAAHGVSIGGTVVVYPITYLMDRAPCAGIACLRVGIRADASAQFVGQGAGDIISQFYGASIQFELARLGDMGWDLYMAFGGGVNHFGISGLLKPPGPNRTEPTFVYSLGSRIFVTDDLFLVPELQAFAISGDIDSNGFLIGMGVGVSF